MWLVCLSLQFEAYVNEGSTGVVVNLTVDDRDDPATGAGRAIYSIINGDPAQSFEIHTNPDNNEGMLSVVKVKGLSGHMYFRTAAGNINTLPIRFQLFFPHLASRLRGHSLPHTSHQSGEWGSSGFWCRLWAQLHSHRPCDSAGHERRSCLLSWPPDSHQDGEHSCGQLCGLTQCNRSRYITDTEHQVRSSVGNHMKKRQSPNENTQKLILRVKKGQKNNKQTNKKKKEWKSVYVIQCHLL